MTRGKKHRIMTQGEIQDIKAQKSEAQATLKELETYGTGTGAEGIDKVQIEKQIKYYDKILEEGKAPKVRGINRDSMVKEAQALKEEITGAMLTRYEMDNPVKNPGAIQKQVRFMKKYNPLIRRYKDIMRQVEPDDPTAVDLEHLRKEK